MTSGCQLAQDHVHWQDFCSVEVERPTLVVPSYCHLQCLTVALGFIMVVHQVFEMARAWVNKKYMHSLGGKS
jgi:hypothetical protein